MTAGSNAEDLDFASVQRGNPEIQRRAQEVIDRCWQLGGPKGDGQEAGKQDPNAAFAAPPPSPAQVAQPKPAQPAPQTPPTVAFSDDDQSREQALRQVPDDPGGLLRARIRSQYTGAPVFLSEGDAQ